MQICPRCKMPVGGVTFGSETEKYLDLLRKTWNEGIRACLENNTITDKDCPYDEDKDPALWIAWRGGVFYAKFKEKPG